MGTTKTEKNTKREHSTKKADEVKKETPKASEKKTPEKKSMRAYLVTMIEKVRAHKKSTLGERSKLIEKFQKEFADRDPKTVQDALVRYINDAKVHPLGRYLLTEDEGGIGITKPKAEK